MLSLCLSLKIEKEKKRVQMNLLLLLLRHIWVLTICFFPLIVDATRVTIRSTISVHGLVAEEEPASQFPVEKAESPGIFTMQSFNLYVSRSSRRVMAF